MKKQGKDEYFVIELTALFKLFRWTYEAPVIEFKGWQELVFKDEAGEHGNEEPNKMVINRRTIERTWEKGKALIASSLGLKRWFVKTSSSIHCTQFEWRTQIGTSDAAQTAWLVGVAWALKTTLANIFLKNIQLEQVPQLDVTPQFHLPQFTMEANIKLRMRTRAFIWAMLQLFLRIIRTKGGLQAWRKILSRPT